MKRILFTVLLTLSVGVALAKVPPVYTVESVYTLPEPVRQQSENREDMADMLRVEAEVTEICPEPLNHAFTLQEVSNAVDAFQRKSVREWRPAVEKALGEKADEVQLYMVNDEGVYRYDAKDRTMTLCADGDFRKTIAEKHPKFAEAKLFLIGKSSGKSIRSELMRQEMRQMIDDAEEPAPPAELPAAASDAPGAKPSDKAVATSYDPGQFLLIFGASDYRFHQLRNVKGRK